MAESSVTILRTPRGWQASVSDPDFGTFKVLFQKQPTKYEALKALKDDIIASINRGLSANHAYFK